MREMAASIYAKREKPEGVPISGGLFLDLENGNETKGLC